MTPSLQGHYPKVNYFCSFLWPPAALSAPSTALIPPWPPGLSPASCPPPSCALPGTFAPRPSLIHLATPLRPGELKALFVCAPWEILTPRLRAPTKQRKHLLTAKALTNSAFQMNSAPCGAEGGECPGEKSPKHLLVFSQITENLVVLYSDLVELTRYTAMFPLRLRWLPPK